MKLTLHEISLVIDALQSKKNEVPIMAKYCPINAEKETKQYQDLINKLRNQNSVKTTNKAR